MERLLFTILLVMFCTHSIHPNISAANTYSMTTKKNIEVIPYQQEWPVQFEELAREIKSTLGDNCLNVYHVGSTSVPGLDAKPTLDIIAEATDPRQAVAELERVGYLYKGEYNIPLRYCLTKRGDIKVNLHTFPQGHPEIELNLKFRDHLRSHPEDVKEYAALKYELLKNEESFVKKENAMYAGYTLGKDTFICKILTEAGFDCVRILKCTHYKEWEAVKSFRNKYFFDPLGKEDPYTWTFGHKDHHHLILYQGVEIVGYAHLQIWPEARVAMRIIVIDEAKRKQGLGASFLSLIENWLRETGYKSIHAEAHPSALAFYYSCSYKEMPFKDPDGYESDPQDVAVGKLL